MLCSRSEAILVYLDAAGADDDPVSVPGITAALELGSHNVADRISLLSALSSLEDDDLVRVETGEIESQDGERRTYALTEAGSQEATRLRSRLESRTITVRNGSDRKLQLSEVDEVLSDPALVRALVRTTDDGVLYLDEEAPEGFVGREDELSTLDASLSAVEAGQRQVALIRGEPGIGKTMLATELVEDARDRGFDVFSGGCHRDPSDAYQPFREALAPLVESTDADSPFERSLGADVVDGEDDLTAQRRAMFDDVASLLADRATENPVVLFLDDLHWADETTLEGFGTLAEFLAGTPVFLLAAYRPVLFGDSSSPGSSSPDDEESPRASRIRSTVEDHVDPEDWVEVELGPFDEGETRAAVQHVVGRRAVPTSFTDAVYEHTGGNPLYVTETMNWLVESDQVMPEQELYPESIDTEAVPDEVRATIDARLSVVDEAGRTALDVAATVGETVSLPVLEAVCDLSRPRLREYVDLFVESSLWERTGEDRVRFANGVLREAILARLEDARREELHAKIAEEMVSSSDGRGRPVAIAYHFEQAGDDERALEYYLRAADRAEESYAHETAADNYERALGIARQRDDDRLLSILESLGRVHFLTGEYDEATRYFEYVEKRAEDPERKRQALRYQGRILQKRSQYAEAIQLVEETAELDDVTEGTCRLLGVKGAALMRRGDLDGALDAFEREREVAEELGDRRLVGDAHHHLGNVAQHRGNPEKAIEHTERAAEIAEAIGDRELHARTLTNLSSMYMHAGETERGRDLAERALEHRREIGDVAGEPSALANLALAAERTADWETAFEYYDEALEVARVVGDRSRAALVLGNTGMLHYRRGDLDTGLERLERAVAIEHEVGDRRLEAGFASYAADVCLLRGELDAATDYAQRAISIADEDGFEKERAEALHSLGAIARERGELETAVEHHERGIEVASRIGSPEDEFYVRTEYVRTALEDDDGETATAQTEAVEKLADDVGDSQLSVGAVQVSGLLARYRGDYDEGERHLREAIDTARELELPSEECWGRYELGLLELRRGDDTARATLSEARDLARELGAGLIVEKCDEHLAEVDA